MTDPVPTAFPAFLQAMGVVAVYAIIRDLLPKVFGKNGKTLTVEQHDKECKLKLDPLKYQLQELHRDLKEYMKLQGYIPPSDR